MTAMSSETEITGTSIERATRSAVRWRVPVSLVGTFGFGHEVDVGAGDAAGVAGQDDGAVHLGQLGQPLRAEGGVEQEAARADRQHLRTVADDHERAHLRPHDAVEPLAQGLARCDLGEGAVEGIAPGCHDGSLGARGRLGPTRPAAPCHVPLPSRARPAPAPRRACRPARRSPPPRRWGPTPARSPA